MDRGAAEDWISAHVEPIGAIETEHERPWATVLRVPLAEGAAWFKACAPVQAFEPRLTAELFARWPDRVTEVLGYDEERAWLLLAGAGTPVRLLGNPPEAWLAALPLYAELQRGEAAHTHEHLIGKRPGPAARDAAGALRGPAAAGFAARTQRDWPVARICAAVCRGVHRTRRTLRTGDGSARRPSPQ